MKKILFLLLIITGTFGKPVFGQAQLTQLQYTAGFAVGDFNDFISQASFRGGTFEYHKMMFSNVGFGFEVGWSAFYKEYENETFTDGTQSISGNQFRYCSTVPVLASVNYYTKPGKEFNPFAGIGIGTEFSRSDLDMGIFTKQVDTWHFALKPEIGIIKRVAATTGLILSAKYYHAFKTQEIGARSYVAANIGLVWGY
ncbi:MAG TPA: hypothetical protein PKD91_02030 [Bacteroidia bacterium]|nr:hypothetical protein [Bacteroidia bacterium]